MRHMLLTLLFGLACAVAAPVAQTADSDDKVIGTWSGPFEGDSVGTYSMTIVRDAEKKLGGTLQATPDGAESFMVNFKSIVVSGSTMTLKYDTGDGGEVTIETTVDGSSLKGTWKIVDLGSSTPRSAGTLTGSKS